MKKKILLVLAVIVIICALIAPIAIAQYTVWNHPVDFTVVSVPAGIEVFSDFAGTIPIPSDFPTFWGECHRGEINTEVLYVKNTSTDTSAKIKLGVTGTMVAITKITLTPSEATILPGGVVRIDFTYEILPIASNAHYNGVLTISLN